METRTRILIKAAIRTAIGLTAMALVGRVLRGARTLGGAMAVLYGAIAVMTYIRCEPLRADMGWANAT